MRGQAFGEGGAGSPWWTNAQLRRWIAAAVCMIVYGALWFAVRAEWLAHPLAFGQPEFADCVALGGSAYRCGAAAGGSAVRLPIVLKAQHEYTIRVAGSAATADPVHLYVDFFAKEYDSPEQKGEVWLYHGGNQAGILRWSSDMPPEHAWLRLTAENGGAYEIDSIRVTQASRGLVRARDAMWWMSALTLLYAFVRMRRLEFARTIERDLRSVAPGRAVRWRAILLAPLHAVSRAHPRAAVARALRSLRNITARHPLVVLTTAAALVGVLLMLRVATLGVPIVFGDEMSYALLSKSLGNPLVYSRNALLLPLPNQLFFDVYHLATLCGAATLGAARALNCVLFALAAFPLFALARRFLPATQALAFAVAMLLMPNSSYTSFFMPESSYFLGFYFVVWAFVAFIEPHGRLRHAAAAGFALAALSLIKPHGLTILAACAVTVLVGIACWRGERRRLGLGFGVLLATFVLARAVLGISAAPDTGETWFDRTFGLYAGFLTHTAQLSLDAQALARLRTAATNNLGSFFMIFAAPLAASVTWLSQRPSAPASAERKQLRRLHLFAYVTLACLLLGTIKFTATIAGIDDTQSPDRIHERYYDFAFALVLLCGYCSFRQLLRQPPERRVRTWLAVAPIFVVAVGYLACDLGAVRFSWVDHPFLAAASYWQAEDIHVVAVLGVLVALLVPFAQRTVARFYAVFLASLSVCGFLVVNDNAAESEKFGEVDRTVLAVEAIVDPHELESGLVLSDDMQPLMRTAFYLRDNVMVRLVAPHFALETAAIPSGVRWILAYGRFRPAEDEWDAGLALPAGATLYRRLPSRSSGSRSPGG